MNDLYHLTYQDEIFQKSQCIWHENTLMDFFRSQLISLGYQSVSDNQKVWQRGDQRVICCLVDDFSTCSDRFDIAIPYLFDSNTHVITDNWLGVPTQYRVHQLPRSFYGIYSHEPDHQTWQPDRRFSFAVRRLDAKRLLLWLELELRRSMMSEQTLDYVNFNAWSWDGDNSNQQGQQQNMIRQFELLEPQFREVYQEVVDRMLDQIPIINHSLTHEEMHTRAWLNIIAETYSSDSCVAISEKIFRAMCLPVPWMVYGGRNTVAYLQSLGFDTMSDLVEHRYDPAIELRTASYGDKIVDFIYEATETVEHMQTQDWSKIEHRARQAATHNQSLLQQMRVQWPKDFAAWWSKTIEYLV